MSKKRFNKKIIYTSLLLVILVVGAAFIYAKNNSAPPKPSDMTAEEKDKANASDPTLESSKNSPDSSPPPSASTPPPAVTKNPPPPPSQGISAFISRAEQYGQTVEIRATVSGTTSGTCSFTLLSTRDDNTIKRQTSVIPDATSSICSLDVPVSEFGIGGEWKVSLVVTNTTSTSNTATQAFEVTK